MAKKHRRVSFTKFLVTILASAALLLWIFRPDDAGAPHDAYFATIERSLKDAGVARPALVIDLDRVDANLAAIRAQLEAPRHYRVVDKSLPSAELIQYVMAKTGSRRVMTFHEPYLSLLFPTLPADTDYLLGKPMPAVAAREFYAALPTASRADASARIQWLVDTAERAEEYAALAEEFGVRLRVNVEIDVGLHRGGARDDAELDAVFKVIAAQPERLRFSGYMGYDGHLPHVPAVIATHEDAVRDAFEDLVARYKHFVDYGKERYPSWFTGEVTLNGAGSKTYRLYKPEHPLNDLAMGSCVVMPSAFDEFTLAEHKPAMFIAAPVLKRRAGFDVPFLDAAAPAAAWWNPNWRMSYYVYGGAWNEAVASPAGIRPNALTTSPPNENLFPNQNLLNGSETSPLNVGDFVFYRPKQGDAIMQFQTIYVMRGGKIVDRWKPLAVRL